MNTEILELVATGDFTNAIAAIRNFVSKSENALSKSARFTKLFAKDVVRAIGAVASLYKELEKPMDPAKHKALLKKIQKQLEEYGKSLKTITGAGGKQAITDAFRSFNKDWFTDLDKGERSALRGSRSYKEINKALRELEEKSRYINKNTKKYNQLLLDTSVRLSDHKNKLDRIVETVVAIHKREKAITIQRRAQNDVNAKILKKNKDLVAVGGVLINKSNINFIMHKKLQEATRDLLEVEKK